MGISPFIRSIPGYAENYQDIPEITCENESLI